MFFDRKNIKAHCDFSTYKCRLLAKATTIYNFVSACFVCLSLLRCHWSGGNYSNKIVLTDRKVEAKSNSVQFDAVCYGLLMSVSGKLKNKILYLIELCKNNIKLNKSVISESQRPRSELWWGQEGGVKTVIRIASTLKFQHRVLNKDDKGHNDFFRR